MFTCLPLNSPELHFGEKQLTFRCSRTPFSSTHDQSAPDMILGRECCSAIRGSGEVIGRLREGGPCSGVRQSLNLILSLTSCVLWAKSNLESLRILICKRELGRTQGKN